MRALIFDLDNCLARSDEPGRELLEPVFRAVRETNRGRLSEEELQAAFDECWVRAFDAVAREHGFSDEMREAGWREFARVEVTVPMRGYGDLDLLPELGDRRFLVTSGFRRLQESKVRALGVADVFDEVVIDALDEPGRRGKERVFTDLLGRHRLDPGDVVVVGDDPGSELASARQLGLRAVQTVRPGIEPAPDLDHVRNLRELKALLTQL